MLSNERAMGKELFVPLSNIWLSDLFNQGVPCALLFGDTNSKFQLIRHSEGILLAGGKFWLESPRVGCQTGACAHRLPLFCSAMPEAAGPGNILPGGWREWKGCCWRQPGLRAFKAIVCSRDGFLLRPNQTFKKCSLNLTFMLNSFLGIKDEPKMY